jgi:hypothetical protein
MPKIIQIRKLTNILPLPQKDVADFSRFACIYTLKASKINRNQKGQKVNEIL